MPELPDLEVFSFNLNKKLAGKKIKTVTVHQAKKLNVSTAALKKALEKQTMKHIYRSGKELFFECKNGTILAVHLMLHGKLEWFKTTNEHKFTIIALLFSNDIGLAITDYQRQAKPTLNPEQIDVPDALDKVINAKFLQQAFEENKKPVKTVLTDQAIIRGIGNAYADEILYKARIDPFSISKKIPKAQLTVLSRAIKSVLKDAQKKIRKVDPHIIGGELRDFMMVHNHKKEKSPGGQPIKHKVLNSRKTYYTSEQQLYK